MIKKKGIYIERKNYSEPFHIIYYDGMNLLIIPLRNGVKPTLYVKYSGTTFINTKDKQRTTIKEVVEEVCPYGLNYVCKSSDDFPILDVFNVLAEVIDEEYN